MASRYMYSQVIRNSYLNVSKEIKANSKWELDMKRNEQLARWNEQETVKRDREKMQAKKERDRRAIEDLKERSELMNQDAKSDIDEYNSILNKALKNNAIDWKKKKRTDIYPQFQFKKINPSLILISNSIGVPPKSFLEVIFKSKLERRITLEKQAQDEYEKAVKEYDSDKKTQYELWDKNKEEFENEQDKYNVEIDNWKLNYETGEIDAIEKYVDEVLLESIYPNAFSMDYTLQYDNQSQILIVSRYLPNTDEIPHIIGYKYVASNKSIKEIYMKDKEQNNFYDYIIKQSALRALYEIFSADYSKNIKSVVFNGWVNGIDKATGQDFRSCIISVQASCENIESINFDRIDVSECIKSLKGVYAGNLSMLAPIKPIMNIDREDKRFIESRDILDGIDSSENLATMPWEDFEHLVRELFTKYFSGDGAEVKVTQSSRDGGVDAIAFDSDPIRGGKYVIQAKRYNRVVPVSAVRDLYGTMINEGAVKGLLVTTSYYGNDSREFVKDKPISLIDGSNLIHMFSEYGYNLKIELQN
jgi:restriction system protein